ncbi:Asp23/Gls24 family envelope stress response protein [Serpentinicella sp. ANB-PHB4]|uniref:Asp23/Gls24 family envelope stress response protein n=1 Tax=Serpentinicella sp. ANB-PHB4 TaxID=3074076 RepID=UPI0028647669|nr:Asp23/Gls24 family envelope stress response protein [Serpentinicella sp. ANB-PHB4]MDR5658749.1 Asp23/Gls24 family envelope stress response protein [Serpentinicella sp. ANB-PHB4]
MATDPMEINCEGGKIKISHDIVLTIARHIAAEAKGIVSISGGLPGGIGEVFSKNTTKKKGVKVQKEASQIVVNLSLVIKYGFKIPEIVEDVQEKVKASIESMTEIQVSKVNVYVQDIVTD